MKQETLVKTPNKICWVCLNCYSVFLVNLDRLGLHYAKPTECFCAEPRLKVMYHYLDKGIEK